MVNTARVPPGSSVVVGLGGAGLAALLGARAAGARQIVGVDLRDSKLALGHQRGADLAFDARDEAVVDKVRAATGGGADFAYECVGKVEAMELADRVTRRGGTTVSSGLFHPETSFAIQHVNLMAEDGINKGCYPGKGCYLGSCVPLRDIPRDIELYRAGRLSVDRLAEGETLRQIIAFR